MSTTPHIVKFKSIEDVSIAIINRFNEIEPEAYKWELEDQAARIQEFTLLLLKAGTITCIMSDTPEPPLSSMFTIPCTD